MPASFTIATIPATVTEGGSITISVTPSGLTEATSVPWVIVPKGKTPISSADFSSLSGTLNFASGATTAQNLTLTPSDDSVLEIGETFELQIYRVVTGGSDVLLDGGSGMVTLTDNETGDFGSMTHEGDGNKNVATVGFSADRTLRGLGGSDNYIISRLHFGDTVIDDTSAVVKFDYDVTINSVWELKVGPFFREMRVTLESGGTVLVKSPSAGGISYQLGDGSALSYAAFKTALGVTGTGTPTGSLLSMSNNYTVSGKTTAPNVTGNPNDPGKVALMYGHANLSVAKSHYATGNAGNDASTPDTVITFTNGTPQTGDDEVVMVLEDWTADLTYTQFDLV